MNGPRGTGALGRPELGMPVLPVAFALIIAACAAAHQGDATAKAAPQPSPRVVFLPEDDEMGFAGSGCVPEIVTPLELAFRASHEGKHVRFDMAKVLAADIEPCYIFNKRYCPPLGRVLGANVFVMTSVRPAPAPAGAPSSASPCGEAWDVRVKAWSAVTDRETEVFAARAVPAADARSLLGRHAAEIVPRILALAAPE